MSSFLRALVASVKGPNVAHTADETVSAEQLRPPSRVSDAVDSPADSAPVADAPPVRPAPPPTPIRPATRPPAAAPRVAALDPVLLADYWSGALDFVDFRKFVRDRSGRLVKPLVRLPLERVSGHAAVPDENGEVLDTADVSVVLTLWECDGENLRPEGRRHFLLAVPGRLTKDGFLAPRTDSAPVFNAAYLNPDVAQDCFAIGERDAADGKLLSALASMAEDRTLVPSWSVWWDTSLDVMRELLGATSQDDMLRQLRALLEVEQREKSRARRRPDKRSGSRRATSWALVGAVYPATGAGTDKIRAVYTAASHVLRREPGRLKLFERLCGPEDAQSVRALPDSARHALVGHIDEFDASQRRRALFPLDATQRLAVSTILALDDGELQAVNGPPGSGKTSMLRAVVASRWVGAALAHQPCPITVACGATNQSVTNVIEAFGNAPHPDNSVPHAQRWIVDAASYGAYVPAASVLEDPSRRAELQRFVCLKQASGRGFPYEYWNRPDPLEPKNALDYEQQYLQRARTALGDLELATVEDAVRHVWERLFAIESERVAFHRELTKGGPWPHRAWSAFERDEHFWSSERREAAGRNLQTLQKRADDVEAAEAVMDLIWRADAFHWAARYWEGRFLLAQRERLLSRHPLNVEEALRRLCMLTPCIVCTLHSVPRLCEIDPSLVHPAASVGYVTALIDLLVVDEAGQASPELAAASFVLARRAAVIGDIKQLAPIWNNSSLSEIAVAAHAGASNILSQIIQSRRSVATGSMLGAARLVSRWREQEDLGVALRYHYRCKPCIIAYCNALSYQGRLIARTREDDEGPEPALAWVSVQAQPTSAGGSWVNDDEIEEIVSWVVERWPFWREHRLTRGKPLQDIVALITPYRPQAERLRSALSQAFDRARSAHGRSYPTAEDVEKVVIGTVHKLQGAERPIVCFSLVEGPEQGGSSFVDGDATLLNVAVSRAKRSFIVFTNPQRLFPASLSAEAPRLSPTHQLGAHLRRSGAAPLYPKRLVLIEAPHKRGTLAAMLGKQSAVVATKGALTKLVLGEGVDVDAGFVPRPRHEDNASDFIVAAIKALDAVNDVVLATDDDRMGEYISWQILCLLQSHLRERRVLRARFGAITRSAVEAAFASAGELDERKVVAEIVREIVDCLITERFAAVTRDAGSNLSPSLSLDAFARVGALDEDESTSAASPTPVVIGRVQAAILRLLVARAREVLEHEHKCRILAVINLGEITLTGEVRSADGRSETNGQTAPTVLERLSRESLTLNGAPTVLREIAPAPHAGTFSLMADAWRRFGMRPWETYDALQALYDGSWLGAGSGQARERAPFDPDDPIEPPARQGHAPVTPLDRAATPESVAGLMVNDHCRHAYSLVWDRFNLSEAGPYAVVFADLELLLGAARAGGLRVSIHSASCRSAGANSRTEGADLREKLVGHETDPARTNDADVLIDSWREMEGLRPDFMSTAARQWDMTLDRLLSELEEAQIGRPSTIAGALHRLVKNGLIQLPAARGALRITPLGFATAFALEKAEPDLSAPEFSAAFAVQLEAIESGSTGPRAVLASLAHHFIPAERARTVVPRIWNSLAELEAAMQEATNVAPAGGLVAPIPDPLVARGAAHAHGARELSAPHDAARERSGDSDVPDDVVPWLDDEELTLIDEPERYSADRDSESSR